MLAATDVVVNLHYKDQKFCLSVCLPVWLCISLWLGFMGNDNDEDNE